MSFLLELDLSWFSEPERHICCPPRGHALLGVDVPEVVD
jgi:hypothetical protein